MKTGRKIVKVAEDNYDAIIEIEKSEIERELWYNEQILNVKFDCSIDRCLRMVIINYSYE